MINSLKMRERCVRELSTVQILIKRYTGCESIDLFFFSTACFGEVVVFVSISDTRRLYCLTFLYLYCCRFLSWMLRLSLRLLVVRCVSE